MNFIDKVVVITGASKGLGRCMAEVFIERGTRVVISSRDENELSKTASEIGATPIVCDVIDEDRVKNLIVETVKLFGRLDVMVNNAGLLAPRVPVVELDSEWVHKMMEVNFFGTLYGSKYAFRQMIKQNSGVIINIVSTSGLNPRVGSVGYAATKFAASGFTRGLALEAADKNISVLGVYPGGIKTPLFNLQPTLPSDYDTYMDPKAVAEKIVTHLEKNNSESELVIRRP